MKYFYLTVVLLFISCKSLSQIELIDYPKIDKESVTELHHGFEVLDDYRNIENLKDINVKNWFKEQGVLTSSILDTLQQVVDFDSELTKIDGRTKTWAKNLKQDENGNLYYLKRPVGEKDFKLFKKNLNGNISELYDPKNYKPEQNKRYQINYFQPSWDGSYAALSINTKGQFSSEILILNLTTGNQFEYVIENVAPNLFHGIHWLPDNDGFTYLHFPVVDKQQKGYKINSVSMLHMIGKKSNQKPIFGNLAGVSMDKTFFPVTKISSSKDRYIFGYIAQVDTFYEAYYAEISSLIEGKPQWKKLCDIEDKILSNRGILKGNRYYYMSTKFSPNYQVLSVDLNDLNLDKPRIESIVSKDEVVKAFTIDSNGVYFTTTKNGVEASLYYVLEDGKSSKIDIPIKAGSIELILNSTLSSGIYIESDGWAVDLMRYFIFKGDVKEQVVLAEIPEFPEFEKINVEELEIKSHDGAMVPVSLIYDSNWPKSSNRPAMIISYGAYGNSQTPYFSPLRLTWVANGGVLVIAHIRGGGEKGEQWHQDGRKEKKNNSWKDIISVTQYLISTGITSKEKTILYSLSAGAISSGMAMIKRPDLFRVFISKVPFINPSRSSAGSYKKSSYLEFGDIANPKEVEFLLGMDPYLNLKPNVEYPATIIAPSAKDDRLDLWESGKFMARLQEYNISPLPVLLDVNLKNGHNQSSNESTARLYGFAKWATEN